jgi:hypothetical protein
VLWLGILREKKKKWKVSGGRRWHPTSKKEGGGSPARKRMEASALSPAVTSTVMTCRDEEGK